MPITPGHVGSWHLGSRIPAQRPRAEESSILVRAGEHIFEWPDLDPHSTCDFTPIKCFSLVRVEFDFCTKQSGVGLSWAPIFRTCRKSKRNPVDYSPQPRRQCSTSRAISFAKAHSTRRAQAASRQFGHTLCGDPSGSRKKSRDLLSSGRGCSDMRCLGASAHLFHVPYKPRTRCVSFIKSDA